MWRPNALDEDEYTLVGQTFCRPLDLRFQELSLKTRIVYRDGDLLGLYIPQDNPIAWSSVPCAHEHQRYKVAFNPEDVHIGSAIRFTTAPPGEHACRQYSFTAILGLSFSII